MSERKQRADFSPKIFLDRRRKQQLGNHDFDRNLSGARRQAQQQQVSEVVDVYIDISPNGAFFANWERGVGTFGKFTVFCGALRDIARDGAQMALRIFFKYGGGVIHIFPLCADFFNLRTANFALLEILRLCGIAEKILHCVIEILKKL